MKYKKKKSLSMRSVKKSSISERSEPSKRKHCGIDRPIRIRMPISKHVNRRCTSSRYCTCYSKPITHTTNSVKHTDDLILGISKIPQFMKWRKSKEKFFHLQTEYRRKRSELRR